MLLKVDLEKCKRDCICELECPFDLIYYDEEGFPAIRKAAKKHCIACGHCVSICPHDALELSLLPDGGNPLIDKKLAVTSEQISQFLKSRRSIRTFKNKPVERELLEKTLDVARYAPSAKNAQPVRWIVYESSEKVRELAGLTVEWMAANKLYPGIVRAWEQRQDKVLRDAPALVVAHADSSGENPAEDCSIACTYLELAAHSLKLGTCWAGFFVAGVARFEPLVRALDLPSGHTAYGALMIGHPKFRYRRIPDRDPAVVRWIK